MYEPGRQHEVSRSGRFPDTQWSLVAVAGDSHHPHLLEKRTWKSADPGSVDDELRYLFSCLGR